MNVLSLALVAVLVVLELAQCQTVEFQVNEENFLIDAESNREVIKLSGGDMEGSVMVIEHNKGLIGWSIPSAEECYLIGGVDQSLPDAKQLKEQFQNGEFQNTTSLDVEDSLTYRKAHDHPVKDLTVLPTELLSPCLDKDVFWLERVSTEMEGHRQKRGFCWYVCVYRNGIRVCYRRCN